MSWRRELHAEDDAHLPATWRRFGNRNNQTSRSSDQRQRKSCGASGWQYGNAFHALRRGRRRRLSGPHEESVITSITSRTHPEGRRPWPRQVRYAGRKAPRKKLRDVIAWPSRLPPIGDSFGMFLTRVVSGTSSVSGFLLYCVSIA